METNKLVAIFLPILAIVTVMIVTMFYTNKKVTKAQRKTAVTLLLIGLVLIIVVSLTMI